MLHAFSIAAAVSGVQVSAEASACSCESLQLKKIDKSQDVENELQAAMQHCFLFSGPMHADHVPVA